MKKFLELPTDENGKPTAYPAVQFTLDRRYIKNDGTLSDWEKDVQTVTWTSKEVEAAYEANSDNKLLEQCSPSRTWTTMPQRAPGGSTASGKSPRTGWAAMRSPLRQAMRTVPM